MEYWDPNIETLPPEELDVIQAKLLKKLVRRLWDNSEFYHERMRKDDVRPDDIQSIDDVTKLPFMYKTDLRDNYPDLIFTEPQKKIIRYHASSGTTGKPTVVGYTRNDLDMWSTSLARALTSCGLGEDDVVQVSNGYGLFTGGLGFHYAAEKIGAAVVPASTGNTKRQLELIKDLNVTAMACTPSYMIHIAELAESMGMSIKDDTKLRVGLLGAEPWSESMRKNIQSDTGIFAQNCYGASELSGPMFTECLEQQGIHVWKDIALVEILDPDTLEPVSPGERGEMVLTILQKEAMPMIRYRIGDITALSEEECACGRTHPRIDRLSGRVDDMLIIRGINVFPSQVEHALMAIPEVGSHYQIEVDRKGSLDVIMLKVELSKEAFTDDIIKLRKITHTVSDSLRHILNIRVDVQLVEPGTLPRFEGKAKRVIDRRNLT
ncbi:MAG: phenylacetate--CoA ligase [Methanomassiliicoccales archaeon]|nr:phenylacetate--CoA ligase [Methanomassiliicoccales archaeon]NYT15632.1 phenylacetate--CoA ligase [Methanomassiliicoccales archaeon]